MPELIVHIDSLDIFPVSWCETNGYPLVYPIKPSGTPQCEMSHHDKHSCQLHTSHVGNGVINIEQSLFVFHAVLT